MSEQSHELKTAAGWLRKAERIVVFTGAGISAESGIATFRDADGFWQKYPPEQYATWDGLLSLSARNPAALADFILELLAPIARAEPNPGHLSLAALERHRPLTLITQNVDGLHQRAGSESVKEIHGTMFEIVAEDGTVLENLSRKQLEHVVDAVKAAKADGFETMSLAVAVRPMMGLGPEGFYRPKLVLFGDGMCEPDWSESLAAAQDCDLFLTVGTSGLVFPAAMLPGEASQNGARSIAIDPAETSGDIWLQGTAGEMLPALLKSAFPD